MTDRAPRPGRNGSGEHRVDQVELRALKEYVAELDKPPSNRQPPSFREICRVKACAAFTGGVNALLDRGWSKRQIARTIGVDVHSLCDWLEGKRQVPAWAVHALPREGRVGYVKHIIDSLPPDDGEDDDSPGKQPRAVA